MGCAFLCTMIMITFELNINKFFNKKKRIGSIIVDFIIQIYKYRAMHLYMKLSLTNMARKKYIKSNIYHTFMMVLKK